MASDTPDQTVSWLAWVPRLLCPALGLYVASVCWRIERLNAEVGYYLPRRDLHEGDNPKWRPELVVDEESWVEHVRRRKNGERDRSPLTTEEHKKMLADTKRWRARGELRELIGGQGLIQYPLSIITGAWSSYLLTKRKERRLRIVAGTALALALMSLGIAFYRGYLTSLGW